MADKTEKAPALVEVTATCRCGATNIAKAASKELATNNAVTYIVHKDGCDNNLAKWQDWITVK